MKGQILVRKTDMQDRHGRDIAVLLGVVTLDEIDKCLYKDGFKYNLLNISMNNGEDISELNAKMSPEDLLKQHIWKIPK